MLVREYTDAELSALLAMHRAQGFGYPFPDLHDPIFVSKLILEDQRVNPSWRRSLASPAKCIYWLTHSQELRASVTRACSNCIALVPPICALADSMTRTPGCRRASRSVSAAACSS